MTQTRWKEFDAWMAFGNALKYLNLSEEELKEKDPDFFNSGEENRWLDYLVKESAPKKGRGKLKTKAWYNMGEDDGITICTMRWPPLRNKVDFDIINFSLAPTVELLKAYKNKEIDWRGYRKEYLRKVKKEPFLDDLLTVAKSYPVTIYCCERSPKYCHRSLVAEVAGKRDPTLRIIVE